VFSKTSLGYMKGQGMRRSKMVGLSLVLVWTGISGSTFSDTLYTPDSTGNVPIAAGVVEPPTVVSITPITSSPTNLEEVEFRVTFSEPVVGVTLNDFVLDSHNLAGEYLDRVSGALNVYTVAVHSGNGEGVMSVDLMDDDSIKDLDNNPLGGTGLGNGDFDSDALLVIDRRGPHITLFALTNPLDLECGSGAFSAPSASAEDALDGDVSANIVVTGTVDPDTAGSYSLTYQVDDSLGNHSEAILVVNVLDTTIPTILLTGDNPLIWPCATPYADPGAETTDSCDDAPQVIIDASAINVDEAGTYTVQFTARDAQGNENYAQREVAILSPCGTPEGEGENPVHAADQNGDGQISLSELLRVIQFFNSEGYHCDAFGEDGYAPGPGDTSCAAHHSDYVPQDWHIGLSELLRLIQFFNSGGYHSCPGENTEDSFCPGPA